MTHSQVVSFLWDAADLSRNTFEGGYYCDVIWSRTLLRGLVRILKNTTRETGGGSTKNDD